MRGFDDRTDRLFSYVSPEQRVPADHPLRRVRQLTDAALTQLSPRFAAIYADGGRPSIPPEQLLRALVLQLLYSVRSERLLIEQLDYNLLFRWFVGLSMDEPVWDHSTFSKNRERLLAGEVATAFFDAVLAEARQQRLLSSEHFTVDGTLLEAWASHKSVRPVRERRPGPPDDPGNPTVDFRGERRTNATHRSTSDPDARLAKKGPGQAAKLAYAGHVCMENRHGLVVGADVTTAHGRAEVEAALRFVARLPVGATVGADKLYDQRPFVAGVRHHGVVPHVAQWAATPRRRSAIDRRTTRHRGYARSQRHRKRVEEIFGWMKSVGLLRRLRHRGCPRVRWIFTFTAAVYNVVRLRTLVPQCA